MISSSWRIIFPIEEIKKIFERQSVNIQNRIIDKTSKANNTRGEDIQKWLDSTSHNIDRFIIIDDSNDMGDLIDHLEKISWEFGLTESNADNIIKYLN